MTAIGIYQTYSRVVCNSRIGFDQSFPGLIAVDLGRNLIVLRPDSFLNKSGNDEIQISILLEIAPGDSAVVDGSENRVGHAGKCTISIQPDSGVS